MRYSRYLAALLLVSTEVFGQADPLYEFSQGNVRIVVYKDQCRLKEVSNIPLRAVWYENGKEIEGCIGAKDDLGVVVAYFADKTIVVLPMQVFRKVVGA